jgi:pimeloyl-ACP methyl ester carboxylesterase
MIFHPGTPVSRVLGRWGHGAAVHAGVRLIALNRPGYGGSTAIASDRGLSDVGRDTAAFAGLLGLDEYAVLGSSGGGPYAVATAIAATVGAEDRACLELLDAGEPKAARDCFQRDVDGHRGRQTPEQAATEIIGSEASAVATDPTYRALWVENMGIVLANTAGYIFDNLAWGGAWDIDPRDVAAPAFLCYGTEDRHCSLDGHAGWYTDRLPAHELVAIPGAAHFEVIDGHWPEVLAGLLRAWSSREARPAPR